MHRARVALLVILLCTLASAPVAARCPNSLLIDQGQMQPGGHFWTSPGKQYGGWFWMAGHGNNLLNSGGNEPEVGVDSGLTGGVPLPIDWLPPWNDPQVRAVAWDWTNPGVDGCGDLNGNGKADPDEVLAVLVEDTRGEEFAVISVGGNWNLGWNLGKITNGIPSSMGNPTGGIPMQPVPRPTLSTPTEAAGGRVEVVVTPPAQIKTFDDVGGGRRMVQGFHILQNDVLLAEIGMGGSSARVKAVPGQPLILRTIFGYPGDAGFYVDGVVTVPAPGQKPEEPGSQGDDQGRSGDNDGTDEPGNSGETPAGDEGAGGAAGAGGTAGAAGAAGAGSAGAVGARSGGADATADTDEDEVMDDKDNCVDVANPDQEDMDEDGVGDFCDSCVFDANPDQKDQDDDGLGDACDPCPQDPGNQDTDFDGLCDGEDNCPEAANAGQSDSDGDGVGDACDESFDPWVVGIESRGAAAKPGGSVQLKLTLKNRSDARRKANVRLAYRDAEGTETAVPASEQCLKKVPMEVDVASEDEWALECSTLVPAEAKVGKGYFVLHAVDVKDTKITAESETALTLAK